MLVKIQIGVAEPSLRRVSDSCRLLRGAGGSHLLEVPRSWRCLAELWEA